MSLDLELVLTRVPAFLFMFALDHAKSVNGSVVTGSAKPSNLKEALLLLPFRERSVFVLRSVLQMDEALVGEIVEIPLREVRKVWMKALSRIRDVLPSDFFRGKDR